MSLVIAKADEIDDEPEACPRRDGGDPHEFRQYGEAPDGTVFCRCRFCRKEVES